MIKFFKPIIEQRFDNANPYTNIRKQAAEQICDFLENKQGDMHDPTERQDFYHALELLLEDPDSERILLYLPLSTLENAPNSFKKAYLKAWHHLLHVQDVRENFHIGDCFELDARPSDGLERVVKCAHLTPWLIKYGYLDAQQIVSILDENNYDEILLQSFKDTWRFISDHHILSTLDLIKLLARTSHLRMRVKKQPLYVSKKRKQWLAELNNDSFQLLTPSAKLEGPFSDNVSTFEPKLAKIVTHLKPTDIVLVGGSKLKGYGTTDSDLDIWLLPSNPGNPDSVHVFFNTIWLCGRDVNFRKLYHLADNIMSSYASSSTKKRAIERLESDLLQYRLLHKGFRRFYGIKEFATNGYPEMDGDCPFYDDKYRKIATMLYAKYVWL
ncbi:hypothetical protein IKF02_03505 [Candidatus Saccharibacteria bacterium]|nr:hypothetical protein [Candidatus Saccharibacteria bacterium]